MKTQPKKIEKIFLKSVIKRTFIGMATQARGLLKNYHFYIFQLTNKLCRKIMRKIIKNNFTTATKKKVFALFITLVILIHIDACLWM